jgi:hypothetical protein
LRISDLTPGTTFRLPGSGGGGNDVLHTVTGVSTEPTTYGVSLTVLHLTDGSRRWTTAPMFPDRTIPHASLVDA